MCPDEQTAGQELESNRMSEKRGGIESKQLRKCNSRGEDEDDHDEFAGNVTRRLFFICLTEPNQSFEQKRRGVAFVVVIAQKEQVIALKGVR